MKKTISAFLMVCTLILAVPFTAQAHPGHSLMEQGAWHALTNADHAFPLALMGAVLVVASFWATQSRKVQLAFRLSGSFLVIAAIALKAV